MTVSLGNKNLMSIDELFAKYKPIVHPDVSSHQGEEYTWKNSLFSTSDKDKAHIQKLLDENKAAHIWTVTHSDCGSIEWAVSGLNYVNRNGFLITEVPYETTGLIAGDEYHKLEGKFIINAEEFDDEAFEDIIRDELFESAAKEDDFNNLGIAFDGEVNRINKSFFNVSFYIFYDEQPTVSTILAVREILKGAMAKIKQDNAEIKSFALELDCQAKPFFN